MCVKVSLSVLHLLHCAYHSVSNWLSDLHLEGTVSEFITQLLPIMSGKSE